MVVRYLTKEKIAELAWFVEQYDSIGYGEAEVIETKSSMLIYLYNAGFSENEELESNLIRKGLPPFVWLVVDRHPIKILEIEKPLQEHKDPEIFDKLRKVGCYRRDDKFKYTIEFFP